MTTLSKPSARRLLVHRCNRGGWKSSREFATPRGLTDDERQLLKTIGVLNLVSSGGTIRASQSMLELCVLDGRNGSESGVANHLRAFETKGLVTHREFADEFASGMALTLTYTATRPCSKASRTHPLG